MQKINNSSNSGFGLLEDFKSRDAVSPKLAIKSPANGSIFKHHDKIAINYEAGDGFSGIAAVEVKIDSKLIFTAAVDLFNYQIGKHVLSIAAFDMAGNCTEKKINFKIIADLSSLIADAEYLYKKGWLKGFFRKNNLIGELKNLARALDLIKKKKNKIAGKIKKIKNNFKLNDRAKEKFFSGLDRELSALDKDCSKIMKIRLDVFEKKLDQAREGNNLNQAGYFALKDDLEYLRFNNIRTQ